MTGTEPSSGQNGAHSLRVSRCRAGAAALQPLKLFFNFYLLAMGSFVAIAFLTDFVISTAQRGITDDYARRFMRGTITLIETNSSATPPIKRESSSRPWTTASLPPRHRRAHLPRPRPHLGTVLKLDAGDIAIDHDGDMMYHRLGTTSKVLVVGPWPPVAIRRRIACRSICACGPDLEPDRRHLRIALWFWIRPDLARPQTHPPDRQGFRRR